jgi:protein-tyrosine phosphatase
VLHGIDDGPDALAGSVAIAEVAAHGGTRTMVATPHLRPDHPRVRPAELGERAAALTEHLRGRGLPLEVLPGAEVDHEVAAALPDAELALATLAGNGRDLLVETPYEPLPPDFGDRLDALVARGFRLTLAHPERNPTFRDRPDLVGALVERGMLVQLTARSLGARRNNMARTLFERRWAHVLASDAHAIELRPPDLGSGLRQATHAFPHARDELEWMVTDAPRAILGGGPLPERPARERASLGRRLRLRR